MVCQFATLPPHRNPPVRCKSLHNSYLRVASNTARPVLLSALCGSATNNKPRAFMKKNRKDNVSNEPIGIVISRGDRTEPTPVFSAYIWGPVPEPLTEPATRAA